MTEHLPECWATYPSDPPAWCICDELRACEDRVLGDRDELVGLTAFRSFRAGLDAAREAVVAVPYDEPEDDPQSREHEVEVRQRYLAAIDALKEKR